MTPWKPTRFALRLEMNRQAVGPAASYGADLAAILSAADFAAAEAEIKAWPDYRATPLHRLDGLAKAAGLGRIWYKDEGSRFGLGSFKALGGAHAVMKLLQREVERQTGRRPTSQELMAGAHREIARNLTVTTATDGNHGRSVAWGAQLFGCPCVIYIHATVSEGRRAAIARYGAEVRRIKGNYDDSVRQAAADAAAQGWQVVSDTSYEGYMEIPRWVMAGYGVIVSEALAQMVGAARATHLFIQAGVGGLPAAIVAALWQRLGPERPMVVVVEPDRADCLYQTAVAGKPTKASGDLETLMAGLAAGETSLLAWEILKPGANAYITVPDESAISAMRALAEGVGGDPKLVGGEAGCGGLAGLLAAAADETARRRLGLDESARVLIIGSEGDTDPALYEKIVGRSGDAVRAS